MKYSKNIKAFTLVELAIVIVIIGLLVAGVLVGQELVKQAQINETIQDFQSYESSAVIFRDKYGCIAGDCIKAQTYFGTSNTQNGDGNKIIAGNNIEGPLVWQHLSLANLIKGSFLVSISGGVQPNINTPSAAIPGSAIVARFSQIWNRGGNVIEIGKANVNPAQFYANGPIFTPIEAQQTDRKLDDGVANTGKYFCYNSNANCSATWALTGIGADYDFISQGNIKTCTCMYYSAGFD